MEKSVLKYILETELGYDLSKELIELDKVSSIYLITDTCLYPNKNARFTFTFKTGIELLEMYTGTTNEAGEFIKDSALPDAYIETKQIAGITLINEIHPYNPIKTGLAV